jgi:OOP family OmpA-OmpF porin
MAAAFLANARSAGALSPPPPDYYTILFAFDSARVDAAGSEIIDEIASKARTSRADRGYGGKYAITATGHADTAGPADYNLDLSLKRAEAVRDALVAAGIAASAITIDHRGETEPTVPTGDGVSERTNRRVTIVME